MDNKRQEFNKLTNETIKGQEDAKKRNSDASLFREEKRIQDDTNRLLKNEILKDEANTLDPYSNTPSSTKISKSRSLTLTNSTYSTKLLEKLVQGQTDNEFTRATLAYQESSLKLLDEIKVAINELKPKEVKKEQEEKQGLEREVSSLAKAIAELNIPELYKEVKRSSIRMFDKTGIMDTMSMIFEMVTSTMGDRSDMMDMVKGKVKNGVLNKMFGSNLTQMINKFESEPLELIQDVINMQGNSNNQFFRALFGKHAKGVEFKKPSERRDDAEEFKALNDKLTYNTINYRLPESLDRIEAALTGNVKRSYDYATNRYLTDAERLKDFMGSGGFVDIRTLSEDLLSEMKDSLETLFESGKISKDVLKEFLIYDDVNNKIKTDKNGKFIFRDERAMQDLMLQIHKSNADLAMLSGSNFSAENFLKNNNIRAGKGISKHQQIAAANMLNRILTNNEFKAMGDFDATLADNKIRVSEVDALNPIYSLFNQEQIDATQAFRNGDISLEKYKELMNKSMSRFTQSTSVSSQSKHNHHTTNGLSYTITSDGNIRPSDVSDPEKRSKEREEYDKSTKSSANTISSGSNPFIEEDNYRYKLELLLNNKLRDSEYYKSKFEVDLNSEGFTINDFMKKSIDKDMIKFEKASELYNKFLTARMTPDILSAQTGQSYDYWKKQGYPTCPADLFKYIDIDDEGKAIINYEALSKLNGRFNEKYVESLEKRYKIETKGVDLDALDPGKTTSNILNEMFKDPTILRSMGVKSGGAAGFFLGKALQAKGVISSPLAPYLLGGVGAAIMNMESVQRRINMVLGPEGDLKGASGFTNREIAMAKFMNKTLPRIGAGGWVAKNFYKMFAGSGALGTGIGIVGGGLLGLITAAVAPSILKFGRNALFGDDGDGNKGVLKSIGGMLRNIPWIEKYLAINIRKEDSNRQLVNYALGDMEREIDARMNELENSKNEKGEFKTKNDKAEYEFLSRMKASLSQNKDLVLKDKGAYRKKDNESDEDYVERIKKEMSEKLYKVFDEESIKNELTEDQKKLLNPSIHLMKERFKNNLDNKISRRDALQNMNGDLADLDFDKNVVERNLERVINSIDDEKERERLKSFFEEVNDAKGKDIYERMANVLAEKVDEDGSKKEATVQYKRLLDTLKTEDADSALTSLLTEDQIKALKSGDIKAFEDSFYMSETDKDGNVIFKKDKNGNRILKENEDFFELIETLNDIGTLNEDYLSPKDIAEIREKAIIISRALSNNPDTDPMVETRADEIVKSTLAQLNKKSITTKMDEGVRSTIAKMKIAIGNLTGDTGILDGEEFEANKELFKLFRDHKILKRDFIVNELERRKQQQEKDLADKISDDNNDDEGSGSGTGGSSTKMFNLKKYKFKNGKSLDLTGCSVATINNMLNSLDLGNMDIKSLINIANKHLNIDGSVRDTFYDEIAERFKFKLTVYKKSSTRFSKKFFKDNKPSIKRGVIILKDNPELSYGHFIHLKSINGNHIIIDDPEKRGVDRYSFADLIGMTNSVYIFETIDKEEANIVKTIKGEILKKSGVNLDKSLVENVKTFIKPKQIDSSISGSNISINSSNDNTTRTIPELLEKIYQFISNGILNIRVVDDVMLPLKVTDGSMSKALGDGRKRINTSDSSSLIKYYDKMRQSSVSREEFEKADAVQDAILNGALSSKTEVTTPLEKTKVEESEILKAGGLGGIFANVVGGGIDALTTAGGVAGIWTAIKSKFFKKAGKEVAEEAVEQTSKKGLKGILSKFLKNKGKDKAIQEMTEKTLKETGEQGTKFLPKIAKLMKGFFSKVFEKSPAMLKRYVGKLTKTITPFIDNFIGMFTKFMKSSKSLIEKKIAKNTAKGTAMKVPYLNIAVGIGLFLYSFYDGYKSAPELLNIPEDQITTLIKIGVGLAKGTIVALPGLILSSVNGWVGAAFEIFMEMYGFKAILDWFLNSTDDTEENKEQINKTPDLTKEIDKENINNKELIKIDEIEDISKQIDNDEKIGSGDPTINNTIISSNDIDKDKLSENLKVNQTSNNELKDVISNIEEQDVKLDNSIKNTNDFVHPLNDPNRTITSAFGPRNIKGGSKNHKGIDFAGNLGDPVYAVKDGKVIYINEGWGFVRIKHADGSSTGYMHMQSIKVRNGSVVKAGQIIGTVGGRGRLENGVFSKKAYSPHLHFDYQDKTNMWEDPFNNNNKKDPLLALNLDPNNLKLSPRSQSVENINYLSRHKELLSKLNDSNKETYDTNAKGGPELVAENTKTLANIIGELNNNIKGMNISSNSSSGDVTALVTTELLKQMAQMNQLIQSLLQVTVNQSQILERVVGSINNLKVDPTDIRAVNISRFNNF